MFTISSERLEIRPLSILELQIFPAGGRNALETFLGLKHTDFQINDTLPNFLHDFDQAIGAYVIPNVIAHPQHVLWYTHWLLIDQKANITVGGIGAAGPPNEKGQAMIGYYIEKKSEGKGFATEAVRAFCLWMFSHAETKSIVADTLPEGFASQRVLQKSGFVQDGLTDEGIRWRLNK